MLLKRISVSSLINVLIFCTGLFCSMPVITIIIGNRMISIFTICFFLLLLFLIYKTIKNGMIFTVGNIGYLFLLWMGISIISSIFGEIYFQDLQGWSGIAISYIPKIIIYLMLYLFWKGSKIGLNELNILAKGYLYGCILNLIWTVIDAFIFYILGFSINNKVFINYILHNNIRYNSLSLIIEGSIRSGGFNYDPAHIGMIAPVIFGYSLVKRNYVLSILALLSLAASISTLGAVSTFLVYIIYVVFYKREFSIHKLKINKYFIFFFFFLLILLILDERLFDSLKMFEKLLFRFLSKFKYGSEMDRITYYIMVPVAMMHSSYRLITGTGYGTASYPYVIGNILNGNSAFDMESTYISYLFNIGLFGLFIYCYLLFRLYKIYKSKIYIDETTKIIFMGIISTIISGFFYHYILYATQLVIIIIGVLYFETNKNKTI